MEISRSAQATGRQSDKGLRPGRGAGMVVIQVFQEEYLDYLHRGGLWASCSDPSLPAGADSLCHHFPVVALVRCGGLSPPPLISFWPYRAYVNVGLGTQPVGLEECGCPPIARKKRF